MFKTSGLITATANQALVRRTLGRLEHVAGVVSVRSPFAPGASGQISS